MILEKYQHIKTPQSILEELERLINREEKSARSMDYKEYANEQTKPRHFLKDALSYRNETGRKSNVIPFHTYFPTFQSLDIYRKNFYFYWRSEAVKGNFLPTELSYIFLFSYELVNYGYSSDAAFNISMLERLYRQYVYRFPKLENYLPNWMADFLLETGEKTLASEWISVDTKENKEYNELKLYEDSIKNMSMNVWWRYVTERSRSPFFTKQKTKIYTVFKEATFFLHEMYKAEESESLFDKMFPIQQVVMPRQLYVSCLLERNVSFEKMMVERRRFDPSMGLFLSELMRVCENAVRKSSGEIPLTIRYDCLSQETEKRVTDYLEKWERATRFKKVGTKNEMEMGSVIPPPQEQVDIVLDFERIDTLKEESNEFQKLYEEKYGEDVEEYEEAKEKIVVESFEEKTPNTPLFSKPEIMEDAQTFIASLTELEKTFLLRLREEKLTVEDAKIWLKTKGLMFGTFLIALNEKAEEHLGDILIEEDDDVFEITEEYLVLLEDL